MNNYQIAAAVALALGGVSAASAAGSPTIAQCQSPTDLLYVAGSSAAQNGFANAVNSDLFGGGMLKFKGTNGNFQAYCGLSQNTNVAPLNDVVLIHYRAEGGSVVGALPIVSGKAIKFLDLTNATVTSTSVTTTGSSGTTGTTDGWGGALTTHTVEVGITDVEPGQFHNSDYPSNYSTGVFGSATQAQLGALNKTPLFDQVFGLFVNTSGFNGTTTTGQAVNLTRTTVANILDGVITDWSKVPTATGGVVSSSSETIYVVNREAGSGTRTGAAVYFLGYGCSQTTIPIAESVLGIPDGYQTADVLTTAESLPGAITYASIDNAGGANLTTVSLSGVAPTNLAATSGQYDWWYEAQLVLGTINTTNGTPIYNFLKTELANVGTAPHQVDILAIPGAGSPANASPGTVPVTANPGTPASIYVNPFTRGSNSCQLPQA